MIKWSIPVSIVQFPPPGLTQPSLILAVSIFHLRFVIGDYGRTSRAMPTEKWKMEVSLLHDVWQNLVHQPVVLLSLLPEVSRNVMPRAPSAINSRRCSMHSSGDPAAVHAAVIDSEKIPGP